jgi:hypothetical protein
LNVAADMVNNKSRCPACGQVFLIPEMPPVDAHVASAQGGVAGMAWVQGTDGKSYGPADDTTLRRWVTELRLTEWTPVRDEGEDAWTPAGAHRRIGPLLEGAKAPRHTAGKTSGLAIASLICGIAGVVPCLSLCGIAPVLSVIFGAVAYRQIEKSGGALGGRGMALAGLVLGAAGVLFSVVSIGLSVLPSGTFFGGGFWEKFACPD